MALTLSVAIASLLLASLIIRLAWWSKQRIFARSNEASRRRWANAPLPLRTLVVLGSGGHTTEMLSLLKKFDQNRYFCEFIVADTDSTSVKRVAAMRPDLTADLSRFHQVPRSREVGQSWSSSAVSTAKAFIFCLSLVWKIRPQVVLVNGPGTCVPVVAAAFFFEIFCMRPVSLLFVESVCRVRSLSMTGKILYRFADLFVVHWEELVERYPKAKHLGVLI
eukprot:TRINITY_DN5331_c2_g1_i1.p1 TRINITY_DN5331_c2_g1~~TRINITY_DN5331_c2_g1_i1.p1  ORF type:complete len:245 (-),score=20.86 TRINITY_DN5331_c2_g1_i1:167-829(-)